MSVHMTSIPMYVYHRRQFENMIFTHYYRSGDGLMITLEGIRHDVSSTNLSKEKKKIMRKYLTHLYEEGRFPEDGNDATIYAEIFKLFLKSVQYMWTDQQIDEFYNEVLESTLKDIQTGLLSENQLLITANNLKNTVMHLKDEVKYICPHSNIMVYFDNEKNLIKIIKM